MDRWQRTIAGVCALAAALCSTAACAAVITIGQPDKASGGTCDCFELQCALNQVESNESIGQLNNEVRLTDSHILTNDDGHVNVLANANLTITGGFPTCDDQVANGQQRGIDGHHTYSDTQAPVFTVTTGAGSVVHMQLLDIGNGWNEGGSGGAIKFTGGGSLEIANSHMAGNRAAYGGGVYFEAAGSLTISNTTIENNTATTLGGGIRAYGTSPNAKLFLYSNTIVQNNLASNGGGVAIDGLSMWMQFSNTLIQANQAPGGYGGGLLVSGHDGLPGHASISSPGNVISSNQAAFGGGIAVVAGADADYADAHLAVSGSGIFFNGATSKGGGIYLLPGEANSSIANDATADVSNFAGIIANSAPVGSAAYLDNVVGGPIFFGEVALSNLTMTDASIMNNTSEDAGFNPTDGAIIHVGDSDLSYEGLTLNRVDFRNNNGGPVVRSDATTTLKNVLIANNSTLSSVLDSIGSDWTVDLRDSTIANNTINGAYVVSQRIDTTLQGVIIDQPGKTMLHKISGSTTVHQVMTTGEVASLNAGPEAVAYPSIRFVDPANGDYHLRAASPALDHEAADGTEPLDFDGNSRDVDLPFNANVFGPRDLGAYERPGVQPLVLNGNFDGGVGSWSSVSAFASWTNDDSNGSGSSGSLYFAQSAEADQGSRTVAIQCVHLPGPGRYTLTGKGKHGPSTAKGGDSARLNWDFRKDGGEACTDGAADSSGQLILGSGTAWSQAASPAVIDVFDWTHNSSITITLIGRDGADTGTQIDVSFDNIALDVEELTDLIFSAGFE